MHIAIIAFRTTTTALLLCTLGYCIYRISKENSETAFDCSASDIETAHTTGWFGENM